MEAFIEDVMNGRDRRLWKALGSPKWFPHYDLVNIWIFDSLEDQKAGRASSVNAGERWNIPLEDVASPRIVGFEFVGREWGNDVVGCSMGEPWWRG